MRSKISATTLGTFEIFSKLPMQEREKIAENMLLKQFANDETVISVTDTRCDVFFVINGCVRASAVSHAGKQVQYEDLMPGMMFGELAAVDGEKRENDCIAVGQSQLAVMSREQFLKVVTENPIVLEAVLIRLTKLVRKQTKRIYEYSTYSVGQRICLEILRIASEKPAIDGKVVLKKVPTHADIAARVSTHREAVSRQVNELQKLNIITWRPGKYVVHDISALAEYCE